MLSRLFIFLTCNICRALIEYYVPCQPHWISFWPVISHPPKHCESSIALYTRRGCCTNQRVTRLFPIFSGMSSFNDPLGLPRFWNPVGTCLDQESSVFRFTWPFHKRRFVFMISEIVLSTWNCFDPYFWYSGELRPHKTFHGSPFPLFGDFASFCNLFLMFQTRKW